jgi:hypothetical protein
MCLSAVSGASLAALLADEIQFLYCAADAHFHHWLAELT